MLATYNESLDLVNILIMSSFTKPFNVMVHNVPLNERPFEVSEGFLFYSNEYGDINIPIGYRTNFADVPRIFWVFIPPCGRYSKATIVHDWLIDNKDLHTFTYQEINNIFLEAMEVLGVHIITRNIIYLSVSFYWKFGRHFTNSVKNIFKGR